MGSQKLGGQDLDKIIVITSALWCEWKQKNTRLVSDCVAKNLLVWVFLEKKYIRILCHLSVGTSRK